MESVVVDCSVVAAFLLREPEGKKIDGLIMDASMGRVRLAGPALLPFEFLNVVAISQRRKRVEDTVAKAILAEFDQLSLEFDDAPGIEQRNRIHQMAREHDLTAYDAAYLELSERLGAPLYTLDRDLLKLKKRMPLIR